MMAHDHEFEVQVDVLASGEYNAHCPECMFIAEGATEDGTMDRLIVHINERHVMGRVGHA